MHVRAWIAVAAALAVALLAGPARAQTDPLAEAYVEAARKVNEDHARKPGKTREDELAQRIPAGARKGLRKLVEAKDAPGLADALVRCGEAALDVDAMADFELVRKRLEKASPEKARELGIVLSRPRFILRGIGGIEPLFLADVAEVVQAVLEAYDEVFGFEEWSKLPGKKLRVRFHLEAKAERPPHFAPQLPFHSEIDFPVTDAAAFTSPTADGRFLFYGLCHELGHVIAMWGSRDREEDHHAWAHYTGVAIVEHLAKAGKPRPFMAGLKDVKWRSLEKERQEAAGRKPSLADRDGVLATLIALHDKVGPRAIGAAVNALDRQDRRLRVNRVRYYTFKELRAGLLATLKDPAAAKAVGELLPP